VEHFEDVHPTYSRNKANLQYATSSNITVHHGQPQHRTGYVIEVGVNTEWELEEHSSADEAE
jgi:hypothetical protein